MRLTTIRNVIHLVRTQGVLRTARSLKNRVIDRYIEYKLGIRTSEIKSKEELGLVRQEERQYAPTDYGSFRTLMNMLDINAGQDVFVDFGAGMGRALVLAGLFPFRRVIGVEISAELCQIAEVNLTRARPKLLCKDVSIVASDAMSYEIPSDMNVAFFFNPFTGSILEAVLNNIQKSLQAAPRQLRVVCNDYSADSEFARQIRACPWLVLQKAFSLAQEGQVGSIYVNK